MRWALIALLTTFLSTCGMMMPCPAQEETLVGGWNPAAKAEQDALACHPISVLLATAKEGGLLIHDLKISERLVVEGDAHIGHLDHVYLIDDGHSFVLVLVTGNCVRAIVPVTLGQLKAISLGGAKNKS